MLKSSPAVDKWNLFIKGPEIIQIPKAENAARKQIYEPGEPFSHVKPVDAE